MLVRGTQAVTGQQENTVQVQCSITFSVNWLAPRLPKFRARHPEIQLNIFTELWEPQEMAEGAAVEIRFSLRPADTVRTELLRSDHYYPVCTPDYPITLKTLQSQPLYDCSNLLSNWASWAEDQGLNWGNLPTTYSTTYLVSLSVALAGGGLCLTHDMIVRRLLEEGRLITPFAHRTPMEEAYYLLLSPQAEETPGAVAFANWIRAEIAAEQHRA